MARVDFYDTSQPFKAAITPGVPDLLCFSKKFGFFVVEVKRDGEKQTPAQVTFEERCKAAGVPYVLGGTKEVAAFLGINY